MSINKYANWSKIDNNNATGINFHIDSKNSCKSIVRINEFISWQKCSSA